MARHAIVRTVSVLAIAVAPLVAARLPVHAQSREPVVFETSGDPRGDPELTVCSQNLGNYGPVAVVRKRDAGATAASLEQKAVALARRFEQARCDVVAVQELLGTDVDVAKESLTALASVVARVSSRRFEAVVGPSNDKISHLGFLVAQDRVKVVNTVSYTKVELPALTDREKPRYFTRGPLEVQLQVQPRNGSSGKLATVVTFHFKSKHGTREDPSSLQWETYRMQMSEALRRIVEERHPNALRSGESLLVLTGDRNSNFDSASAKILEGTLSLENFQGKAPCRLSGRGVAFCQPNIARPPKLISLLVSDPEARTEPGTFFYQKVYSWLDDILVPPTSARAAWSQFDREGNYAVGVVRTEREASDHALVWASFNW